jgi:hypothetical protein
VLPLVMFREGAVFVMELGALVGRHLADRCGQATLL